MRFESGVPNRQRERSRGETGFAQALAGFLRKMAQHCGECNGVVRIFAEGVVVRNRFGFGVNYEFVGVPATRFTIQRGAPLPENFIEFFEGLCRKLLHRFDAEGSQRTLRHFANAGNFADG